LFAFAKLSMEHRVGRDTVLFDELLDLVTVMSGLVVHSRYIAVQDVILTYKIECLFRAVADLVASKDGNLSRH
jgi:hypothetical protein